MKNLSTAIFSKFSGSSLDTIVGGRMFKGRAPEMSDYPHIVYMIVDDTNAPTFSENFEDVTIQFSLYSQLSSTTEIESMYTALIALYDEATFPITDETLIFMDRQSTSQGSEEHNTASGLQWVWHYPIEYLLLVQRTP